MKFEWKERGRAFKRFCAGNKRAVFLLCLAAALIAGLQIAGDLAESGLFVAAGDGRLTAIKREDPEDALSLPLHVKIEQGGLKAEENVTLYLRGGREEAEKESEEEPTQTLKDRLDEVLTELEQDEEALVKLPEKLEDGTKLSWSRQAEPSAAGCLLIVPLGLFYLYRSRTQKEKEEREEQVASVRRALPGFNNQLLLLLNSGLIFSDAFMRIAESCRYRQKKDAFSEIIEGMLHQSKETGSSLISVMENYSRNLGIREFSRLTGIISDNQYKGVDLTEKLEAESDILWTQRKKTAEEKGRTAETKLSFPLAVLLLVLILIAAAPAMLQM